MPLYKFTNSPLIRSDFLSRQLCSLVMLILANISSMHSSLVKTLLLLTLCISSAVGAPISPSESNLAHDTGDKNVKSNAPIADNAVVNDNVLSHPNKFGTLAANGFSTSPKATQTLGNPRCHVSGGCPKCTHVLPRHGKADAATGPFQAKALGTNHLETRDSPDRRRCRKCRSDPIGQCPKHCIDCRWHRSGKCHKHCADCKESRQRSGCDCPGHCLFCDSRPVVGKCIPYHCPNCTPDYTCGPHQEILEEFSEEERKQIKAGETDPEDLGDYHTDIEYIGLYK